MKVVRCTLVLAALFCCLLGASAQRLFISKAEFIRQQQQQQSRRSLREVVSGVGTAGYGPGAYSHSPYSTPIYSSSLPPVYSPTPLPTYSPSPFVGDRRRQLRGYGSVVTLDLAPYYSPSFPPVYAPSPPSYNPTVYSPAPLPYAPVTAGGARRRALFGAAPFGFAAHHIPKLGQHSARSLHSAGAPAAGLGFSSRPVVSGFGLGTARSLLGGYYGLSPYAPSPYSPGLVVYSPAPPVYAPRP